MKKLILTILLLPLITFAAPIRSMDEMKFSKDVVRNQPSTTQIRQLLQLYKTNFPGLTHIAISVPLNNNSELIASGNTPNPQTIENFEKTWMSCWATGRKEKIPPP